MPAVQEILSTINQFAQARLAVMGWRTAGFEASGLRPGGPHADQLSPPSSDLPEGEYAHAGPEPDLDEVLGDPVVQLIMQADRVQLADLEDLAERTLPDFQPAAAVQVGSVK